MSKIVVVLSTMLGDLRGATCAGRLVLTPLFGASVFWRSRPFGWAVRLGRSVGPSLFRLRGCGGLTILRVGPG